MSHAPFYRERSFWIACLGALVALGTVFLWQLGVLPVWSPARMPPETGEYMFAAILLLLLSVSAGLYMWHHEHKSCPIGTGKASGIAGIVGTIALICPACTVIPITLLGASVSLSVLGPFMPLLRIVALLIATVTLVLLWPRTHHHA